MVLNPEITRRIKASADFKQAFRNFRAAASITQPIIHNVAEELAEKDPEFTIAQETFAKFWVYERLFETACRSGKVIPKRYHYDNTLPYVLLEDSGLWIKQSPVRLIGQTPRENSIVSDFMVLNEPLFHGLDIRDKEIRLILTHGPRIDGTWGFCLGMPGPRGTWLEELIDVGKLIDGNSGMIPVQTEILTPPPIVPRIKHEVKKQKQRKEKWQEEQQRSKEAS
jgi:hypothetical protein